MQYIHYYNSPIGLIIISADDIGLTGIWFEGQKYCEKYLEKEYIYMKTDVLQSTIDWLDTYFSGDQPTSAIPMHIMGSDFEKTVWKILKDIPYGYTKTYGEIAREIAEEKGIVRMSAQAVGGAVGRNRFAILIPCHRVLGAKGELTGYAAGIERKNYLLELEKARE